ncbi:hypothetical protein MSP8887_01508 [Marinomonas spartinae]|uniref:Uncharacterized protein n=1 Tax=Marinomonas spartinae TaxID=1792290 RepID=A0A1A8TVJ9_9GAMM|nr:hypothetical protein [Marinomonas spartinae]SBS31406.1 hypothetical protein MSP8887_01508 [Marinomonas spartinae]SBS37819.1 hypothetical protein MSP8886_04275 [Marinomonas spartinae]
MEEIKLFKELGLDGHLHVAAYVLLFSFIVKTLYTNHIQQFLSDITGLISRIMGRVREAMSPSLYDILPERGKRFCDFIEVLWSYIVTVVAAIYFVIFVMLSKYIDWSTFNFEKGVLYFGTLIVFLSLVFASMASGNRAIQSFRGV